MKFLITSFEKLDKYIPKIILGLGLLTIAVPSITTFSLLQQNNINDLDKKIYLLKSKASKIGILQEEVKIEKDILVIEKDKAIMQSTAHLNLLQALGGALILFSAYVGWRNLGVAENKQVTERFAKAIEHLGNNEPAICLGGVYTLEQIAADSYTKYHRVFTEIISAFIREKSLLPGVPRSITYIAFNVLGRRKIDPFDHVIDLSLTDLSGIISSNTRFTRANFNQANFSNSSINRIWFKAANLSKVNFSNSTISNVNFANANLTNAIFKNAIFDMVNLEGADLTGSDLTEQQLHKSIFDKKTKLPENLRSVQIP
jgi:hypothetical protein